MPSALDIADTTFFQETSLSPNCIDKILSILHVKHVDDGDLYFQTVVDESWYLEDSIVKEGHFSLDQGIGIRVISGEKTGYAYSDNLVLPAIEKAACAARSIAFSGGKTVAVLSHHTTTLSCYEMLNPIQQMEVIQKIDILKGVDQAARAADPRVIQVYATLDGSYEVIMMVGLHGERIADVRPMVTLNVRVVVQDSKGRLESARVGGGGRLNYTYFLQDHKAQAYAQEAVRQALLNLEAYPAPAGVMPVVLGSGWPGVLLHEAVGHGLEGDFNRKKLSAFSGRLGQQVASKGITVVDDGTLPYRRGSLIVDDEGTPGQYTVLIEDGILVNYMQDKLNARLMHMQPTGNGRRESYAHVPIPRMTNTYMLAGHYHPEEIIRSVDKGLYAVNFSGGQVDITSGQFVFSTSEAYLIEEGKVTKPVKGATLVGNGPQVMQQISMVGNDLALDQGIGVCGKDGQSVPVGVGQPTLKIEGLTVGGTDIS